MQHVDGAQLIFRDPVRTAKIVRFGAQRGVFVGRRLAEIAKYIVNLLLREYAVYHISLPMLHLAALFPSACCAFSLRIPAIKSDRCSRLVKSDCAELSRAKFRMPGVAGRRRGHRIGTRPGRPGCRVANSSQAQLVVLNTCTVTVFRPMKMCARAIHRVHRENPEARILVTGCYAQRAPEELAVLPGVYWVVGNSHKVRIPEIVAESEAPYHGQIHVGDIFAQHDFLSAPVEDAAGDRTRPNLKIQDGCNNRCSFCIIPFVRGPQPQRSRRSS